MIKDFLAAVVVADILGTGIELSRPKRELLLPEATDEEKEKQCSKQPCVKCPILDHCSLGLSMWNYDPIEDMTERMESK